MPAWEAAVDYARAFARDRAGHIDAALLANLGLTGHAGLSLSTEPEGAGAFHLAVVDVSGPFAGTYYAGVPVTVTALPGEGWTFAGWSDASPGNDPTVTVPMDADTTLVARFSARQPAGRSDRPPARQPAPETSNAPPFPHHSIVEIENRD